MGEEYPNLIAPEGKQALQRMGIQSSLTGPQQNAASCSKKLIRKTYKRAALRAIELFPQEQFRAVMLAETSLAIRPPMGKW